MGYTLPVHIKGLKMVESGESRCMHFKLVLFIMVGGGSISIVIRRLACVCNEKESR